MFVGPASSQSRLDNYKSKVRAYSGTGSVPDYTAPVVQFKLGEMYRKMQRAADDQTSYQTRLIGLLGGAGVQRITYGAYNAFAGQLYKLCQKMSGSSLATEAAVVIGLWTARGLNQAALQAIRTSIFNVSEPLGE